MTKHLISLAALAALASPALAEEPAPSPNEIVEQSANEEWIVIDPEDLLVMTLAPDAAGNDRKVIIQLIPAPFSADWTSNIRTFARSGWYDNITVNRVQDNYVVQWGDANYDNPEATGEPKLLPEGLLETSEADYSVGVDALSEVSAEPSIPAWGDATTESDAETAALFEKAERVFQDPNATEDDHAEVVAEIVANLGLDTSTGMSENEKIAMLSIRSTRTNAAPEGWHQRDSYAEWVEFWRGWPIGNFEIGRWFNEQGEPSEAPAVPRHEAYRLGWYQEIEQSRFWPLHCYGMVGVGRSYSPDAGTGAELYTVIGHAPRHLDRNIALVGRIIEGIEHLTALPRGGGELGFYADPVRRTPILTIRVASDLPEAGQQRFEYLNTEGETFARYVEARANRRDPFFIVPAGGADICNIPVPVRRVAE